MEDPRSRNIALCVVLTLVTCGIYGLYWLACLHEDLERESGEYSGTSGALVVVLSIVTCGIYLLYWMYKAGEKESIIKMREYEGTNMPVQSDSGILYLILSLFGFSIVSYALIQSNLNNFYIWQNQNGGSTY